MRVPAISLDPADVIETSYRYSRHQPELINLSVPAEHERSSHHGFGRFGSPRVIRRSATKRTRPQINRQMSSIAPSTGSPKTTPVFSRFFSVDSPDPQWSKTIPSPSLRRVSFARVDLSAHIGLTKNVPALSRQNSQGPNNQSRDDNSNENVRALKNSVDTYH